MDRKCFEVNNIAGSSNGRIADSESVHLGSNPSTAAFLRFARQGHFLTRSENDTNRYARRSN